MKKKLKKALKPFKVLKHDGMFFDCLAYVCTMTTKHDISKKEFLTYVALCYDGSKCIRKAVKRSLDEWKG